MLPNSYIELSYTFDIQIYCKAHAEIINNVRSKLFRDTAFKTKIICQFVFALSVSRNVVKSMKESCCSFQKPYFRDQLSGNTTCHFFPTLIAPLKSFKKPKKMTDALPAGNYMFKVNNRNTSTRCEICSKLTITTPEQRQWRRSGVFIINFEHITYLDILFLSLILSR